MDFRNKYLKYKPEITFDIFEKIWNKLVADGWNPAVADKKAEYNYFSTDHIYLQQETINSDLFGAHTLSCGLSETTVQEILGYDPFVMDDDFVLPEKWCCKITEESIEIFNNWRISMSKHYLQNKIDKKYPYIINDGGCNYTAIGTEITFYQFKKYVLKQNVEKGKEVIPEYVEALIDVSGYFIKGNIYKVESSQNIKSCRLISNIKSGSESAGTILLVDLSNNNRFKPSTKSAFDAQNQPKQPLKQAVHCETQEQWDFVLSKIKQNVLTTKDYLIYTNRTCWTLFDNCCATIQWCAENDVQILSFSDWCAQSHYDFQPKSENFYVVCETEKESDLCLMWAVDNGLVCDTRRVFISGDSNVFEVFNGTATVNVRKAACSSKNKINFSWIDKEMSSKSKEDKYMEVLRKNAKTFGGEMPEISKEDFSESVKNMFDFGAKNVDDNLRNSISHGDVTLQGLNNSAALTTNSVSETIDMAIQTAKVGMLKDALKSFTCDIQHYDHEFLAQMLGVKVSKVNKVQISTDNEIKINIIQKQSIKI